MAEIENTLNYSHEIESRSVYKDGRTISRKLADFLENRDNMLVVSMIFIVIMIVGFAFADWIFLMFAGYAWFVKSVQDKAQLGIVMPKSSGFMDPGEPHLGTGKPTPADGIIYLGNEEKSQREVWLTNVQMRTHMLTFGTTGSGKAQPLDVKIHTPNGWVRMGDIKPGMMISTPDGGWAPVTAIYPQGMKQIYRITFEDGRSTEACGEHLWEIHHKHWRGKYKPGVSRAGMAQSRVMNTEAIVKQLAVNKGKFAIALPLPVVKSEASLAIDPYLLGALLGDGYIGRHLRFSTADQEMLDFIAAALPSELMLHQYPSDAKFDYWIKLRPEYSRVTGNKSGTHFKNTILNELDKLGLKGVCAHDKFIPESYKNSSIEQRTCLLQGLMDTDGYASNSVSFTSCSKQLAIDVQDIVRSLGGIAKITQKKPTYTYKGEKKTGRLAYTVNIRHPNPESLFKLSRKRQAVKDYQYADSLKLGISKIEPIGEKEAQCIMVDHPDHLYITDDYVVTHNTEQLLGLVFNALVQDSGFIYVDGKADSKLYANIYQMARFAGREDDVLTINFQKGGKDIFGAMTSKMSNTMNPFAFGSSGMLSQLLVGLMSSGENSGGDVWENRAILFTEALLKPLVFLRDKYGIMIDAHTIRSCFEFSKIEEMVVEYPKRYEGYSDVVSGLKSYLVNIPGYDIVKTYKNPSETALEQHGYITMQLVRTLGSLADTYGYIMRTPMPEIDMRDVFLNRRILVVLLPALENSPQELTNLGRIIVASLKSTMAVGLGAELEGDYRRVIQAKPTTSKTPFICVLDEYGYYAVKGFAVVPAQARSLGFAACFAGQDLPGFEKSGKEEAESTIGNTTTKLCGKLECVRTFEFFDKVAGEAFFMKSSGTEKHSTDFGSSELASKTNSFERTRRLNIIELQKLKSGQWYIFRNGKILRAKSFYTDLENEKIAGKLKTLRLNHFIRVAKMETKVADKWRQAHLKTVNFLTGDKEKFGDTTGTVFDRIGHDYDQNSDSTPLPPEKSMLNILMGVIDNDQANASATQGSVLAVMDTPIRKRMQLIRENRESAQDDIDAFNNLVTGGGFGENDDIPLDDLDSRYEQFGFDEDSRFQSMDAFSEPAEDRQDFPPAGINEFDMESGEPGKEKKRSAKKAGVLDKRQTKNALESIEYLGGSDMDSARIMARDKLTELSAKTKYPMTRPAADRAREYFAGSMDEIFQELEPEQGNE